jgi:hypothetical protein
MGQHRRAISTKSQPPAKKSQSPFFQNPFKTLKIQGSRSTVPGLWDGSVPVPYPAAGQTRRSWRLDTAGAAGKFTAREVSPDGF